MDKELRDDKPNTSGRARFYLGELEAADRAEKTWRKRAMDVVKRYRDDKKRTGRKYNILYANTEILKPATYSQVPLPDVRRRYMDKNEVARDAVEVLERALSFTLDDPRHDFDSAMDAARDDMLLPGRGVIRVVYEPTEIKRAVDVDTFEQETEAGDRQLVQSFSLDGEELDPDDLEFEGDEAFLADFEDQEVYCEYVYWEDYRESPAKQWEDVWWVAYRHLMTRAELKKNFPEHWDKIPLEFNTAPDTQKDPKDTFKRAAVWEVWDKTKRKQVFVSEGYDEVIEENDDPLGLTNFFPQPEPVYAVKTTDSRVPVPLFFTYQDQAAELDDITARITRLIRALKAKGLYSGVQDELKNIMDTRNDDVLLVALRDGDKFINAGGLDKAITWFPIEQIAKVIAGLYVQRDQLRQEIFEITGISDIIRGSSEAKETFGAQRIKATFGNLRLVPLQKPMKRLARDLLRIKAEIMAEHFTVEMFQRMTGLETEHWEGIIQMYRDENSRMFNVDIETDSTITPDPEVTKQRAVEFTTAITQFFVGIAPIVEQQPLITPLVLELLKWNVRQFNTGRELEDTINSVADELQEAAEQAQQQPDPAQEMEERKLSLEEQKALAEDERDRMRIEQDEGKAVLDFVAGGDR